MDTIIIHLKAKDTSFYAGANIDGQVYNFIDIKDTLYLSLTYTVSGFDMGTAGLDPKYIFKKSAPDAVYKIIINNYPTFARYCNCSSLQPMHFSYGNPVTYQYSNDKSEFTGKCSTFYSGGALKEMKNYYNGFILTEESWHENGDWASQVQYKPNSNSIAGGSWYFSDRSAKFNTQDTLITETYPDGSRKSLSRFTTFPRTQIEYMFWSPTNKLIKHWKIVDSKKVMILNITDPIIEKGGKLIYVETQTCDSMAISDSLVKVNGFNTASKENRPYYAIRLKASGTINKDGFLFDGKYFIYDCKGKMLKYIIFSHGQFWGEVKIE